MNRTHTHTHTHIYTHTHVITKGEEVTSQKEYLEKKLVALVRYPEELLLSIFFTSRP